MNVNDSERIFSLLEMANFTPVSSPEEASLIIINTCSVREKPVHKVHSEVGRYRKLKETNPKLRIGIGGCVGQQEKERLLKDLPLVDFVFGTDAIDLLPELVGRVEEGEGHLSATRFEYQKPYQIETLVRAPGVSTFVNVTKGCDNFCTFCVVPYTRGRERSRGLEEIVRDIKSLVSRGVREVTLLGQNVNSYRSPNGGDFADLLEQVALQSGLVRIRFTTSHPKDFDEKLVQVISKYHPQVCEYIHLPFQSGSSEVLTRMNRGYTRSEYIEKIAMIRNYLPQVVFSSDAIVGFPGESEEQFEETLSLVEEVGYETLFAFKYSPRPFTKAARFGDQIDETTKGRRLTALLEVQDRRARQLVERYRGTTTEVLVENRDEKTGLLSGRSSQNKLVFFEGELDLIGKMVFVRVTEVQPSVFRGEMIGDKFN